MSKGITTPLYAILPALPGRWTIVYQPIKDENSQTTGSVTGYGGEVELRERLSGLGVTIPIVDFTDCNMLKVWKYPISAMPNYSFDPDALSRFLDYAAQCGARVTL